MHSLYLLMGQMNMVLEPLLRWFLRHPAPSLLLASLLLYGFAVALERILRRDKTTSTEMPRTQTSDSAREA